MSTPAQAATGRRGRWRWSVALVATVVMVVSGSGLVAFAQSGAGVSAGPQFVPADAPIFIEARLDMPDGQAESLAGFLSAFPGFADEGSFQLKVDEALDGLIAEASQGAVTMSDIRAFATGEIGVAIMELSAEAMESDEPPMVIGFGISDSAAADTFVAGMLEGAEAEAYGSATLYDTEDAAVAVTAEWVLLSPQLEQVQAAVDVLDGNAPGLADDPGFSTAFARVPAGHLVSVYVDLQSLGSLIELGMTQGMTVGSMPVDIESIMAQMPDDMVAYLAAEPDRLTLEAFITPSDATPAIPVGESDLAGLFPGDTQIYVEARELGAMFAGLLNAVVGTMDEEAAAELAPIEDMLGVPLPQLLDFASDAGIGAGLSSDGMWLGIAAELSDPEAAAERVERLMSIVTVIGASDETGISIETETVGDTEVSTITLPIDSESMGLPFDIGQTLSVALTDEDLLIGTGDFVTNALVQAETDSLGATAAYTDALADDTTNAGLIYVDVGSLLAEIEPLLAGMIPEWADIAPYATALDRFIAVGTADEEILSARMSVIAGE
jgi:hypothetical protein